MTENRALDRTDFEILRLLQNNARLSNKEIAAAVDLAPSSCHERVRALRQCGALREAHAEVDPQVLGIGIEALLMIGLAKHSRDEVDRFLDDVTHIPEVRTAFLVTGQHDLVVHVAVRDMRHLKDLALDSFTARPGVTRIETSIIFDQRRNYELPLLVT